MSDFTQEFYRVVIEGEGVAIKDIGDDEKCVMHIPGRAGLAIFDRWNLLQTSTARLHFIEGVLAGIKVGGIFATQVKAPPEITRFYVRDAADKLNPDHAQLCVHVAGFTKYVSLTLTVQQQAAWTQIFNGNIVRALNPKKASANG